MSRVMNHQTWMQFRFTGRKIKIIGEKGKNIDDRKEKQGDTYNEC